MGSPGGTVTRATASPSLPTRRRGGGGRDLLERGRHVPSTAWRPSPASAHATRGGTNPGTTVNKPDVVAPDGVSTATYGASNGTPYRTSGTGFFGTSGAAPHVAGMAATVWEKNPGGSLADLRTYIQAQAVYKAAGGTCGGRWPRPPPSGTQNNRYGWGRIDLRPATGHHPGQHERRGAGGRDRGGLGTRSASSDTRASTCTAIPRGGAGDKNQHRPHPLPGPGSRRATTTATWTPGGWRRTPPTTTGWRTSARPASRPPRAGERALHRQPDRSGAGPVRREPGAAGSAHRGAAGDCPGRGRGGRAAEGTEVGPG